MMEHAEFNTFKTNGTYLVFGIYTELKSRTVVLDSASCIVSSRLFQLHQNKHQLMTFFMLLTRLRAYPILVFQSSFLTDFLIPKRKERQSEKVTGKLKVNQVLSQVITRLLMANLLFYSRFMHSKFY